VVGETTKLEREVIEERSTEPTRPDPAGLTFDEEETDPLIKYREAICTYTVNKVVQESYVTHIETERKKIPVDFGEWSIVPLVMLPFAYTAKRRTTASVAEQTERPHARINKRDAAIAAVILTAGVGLPVLNLILSEYEDRLTLVHNAEHPNTEVIDTSTEYSQPEKPAEKSEPPRLPNIDLDIDPPRLPCEVTTYTKFIDVNGDVEWSKDTYITFKPTDDIRVVGTPQD